MPALSYFRSPFPSTAGFSAYRMPGMAVHVPLIFSFSVVGFFLCWPHEMLRPLLLVWVLGGVYLGRDITILCHYNPLLTLFSWAAFGMIVFAPRRIAGFGASHVVLSCLFSVVVGAVLGLVAFAMARNQNIR